MPDPDNPNNGPDNSGQPVSIASFIGEDGTLSEGWTKNFDEKDRPTLERIKKVDDFPKSYMELRRKFNKDPNSLIEIPRDDSPDEVKLNFKKAYGWSDNIEDYKYELGEDLKTKVEVNEDDLGKFKEFAQKEMDLSPDKFKKLMDYFYKYTADGAEKYKMVLDDQKEQQVRTALEDLKKEWGNATDEKIARANMILKKFGGEDAVASIGAENSPEMIKFLDSIAGALSEDTIRGITNVTTPTPTQIDEQVAEIRKDPDYLNRSKDPKRHQQLREKVQNLLKQKYGSN